MCEYAHASRRKIVWARLFCALTVAMAGWALPGVAHATCAANACSSITVGLLNVMSDTVTPVGTSGDDTALNCTPVSNTTLTLDPAASDADWLYPMLLSHRVSGMPLRYGG